MNKTVELVNLWAEFEKKHPKGSIEEFCRYQLISKRKSEGTAKMVGGIVPPNTPGLLFKIIGRISRMHATYCDLALKGTGLNQIEEFGMLLTVEQRKDPRKTEVIYDNLQELSSGTDIINRLIKRGLVTEHSDKDDKRAKRLHLTATGAKTIVKCKARIIPLVRMMATDMSDDDQKLCIQLLKGIEIKFSERWQTDKAKTFDEVYEDVMSNKDGAKKK
jgi:DNA-binding MarR family transcriptional regulator